MLSLIIASLLCLLILSIYQELVVAAAGNNAKRKLIKPLAATSTGNVFTCVIISTRPYHFDVSAFLSFHMQHLGFSTEIWLRSSFIRDDTDGAYSLFKSLNSSVIRDVGDGDPGKKNPALTFPAQIKVLMISTADGDSDIVFLCKIGVFERLYAKAESVIFVVHNAQNIPIVAKYCMKPKCTMLVLANHVLRAASYHLQTSNYSNTASVLAVPTRIYNLPVAYFRVHYPHPVSLSTAMADSHSIRQVAIQGTLIVQRRNYDSFFRCLTEIQQRGRQFKVNILGWRSPRQPELKVPAHLAPFISVHENLKFHDYFPIISQSDLLVTFSNSSYLYYSDRGTSSVPTGLNCGVGLVMPATMLDLYPCLRHQIYHKQISKENDCESLKEAMELSDLELDKLKKEIGRCRKDMMRGAREVLNLIAHRSNSAYSIITFDKCPEASLELRTRPIKGTIINTKE
ncbi:hypothetical protein EON65_17590 [archaeon]|nr:MAG: hypothetical protein EON65_17590 [archaeon]